MGPGSIPVRLAVNGREVDSVVEPRTSLADLLRDGLDLTGTHTGCEEGVCGACTVLVDGTAVRSCLMLAVQADRREVTTVEGLVDGDSLHPVQESFKANHSFQCGFCSPGIVISTVALLGEREGEELSDEEIREAISGHICRCTGYQSIVEGIRDAVSAK